MNSEDLLLELMSPLVKINQHMAKPTNQLNFSNDEN